MTLSSYRLVSSLPERLFFLSFNRRLLIFVNLCVDLFNFDFLNVYISNNSNKKLWIVKILLQNSICILSNYKLMPDKVVYD